ncbi:DMT family transporter [Paraclostridium sordellii]|uniref:Membrane protein n=1 Tax=Paraclostridium sordellii TaxID=1505 RepID=A0A0A1S5E0_PARSO|nr:DMT family transporter [Paeniclostridium sordellii]EPZ57637.1 eamA-like transporter family protein [[Clostridium] sordellii VPI 9048] [Paeniclostridium sordellii VPI 9048]MBS6022656.1 EamA family transporter [Paeniclostridium sordellii]MDU6115116.1 DMT family transporter [Paeniclostridium sordellii]MRZ79771.1 EamA family transporter [Paeniclostridium sordellii]MSB58829.1 EamA family transporter [Paeniclostridium sordellii]
MDQKIKGYLFVVTAGVLWATLGLFVNSLLGAGLTPEQVAFLRLFLGFLILFIYSFIKMPNALKISKKGLGYCILVGIISQAGFNVFYFNSINTIGVSASAVLLYTSPLFLTILSMVIFKEKLNKIKVTSLIVCFMGSILAVTGGSLDLGQLSMGGILLGVMSAITYACMSIISKGALKECEGITLLIYGFLVGAILMIPLANPVQLVGYTKHINILFIMIGLGIVPAAAAYIFYLNGISTGIDLSIAGILASTELIVSVIIGWTLLGEDFSIVKSIGVLFMIISAFIAIKKPKEHKVKYNTKEHELKTAH